ncbi:hypothetical protein, partial [Salmonella enterica]
FDLEVISAYSGKGWPCGDWFNEDLLDSHEIMLKAIETARNSTNCYNELARMRYYLYIAPGDKKCSTTFMTR